MLCNQCEQTFRGVGCTTQSVCGKTAPVSDLFDLLLFQVKGIAWMLDKARQSGQIDPELDRFVIESLFLTVTNVNFDEDRVANWVIKADSYADRAAALAGVSRTGGDVPAAAAFVSSGKSRDDLLLAAANHSIADLNPNQDIQSLIQLVTYGIKGLAAYAEHAAVLGSTDDAIFDYLNSTLAALLRTDLTVDELVGLNLKCGEVNILCMKLLNDAHIGLYGQPVPTPVSTGTKAGPAIVVSGHDLYMLDELLKQCEGQGIHVYTHGEMLPAHGYPGLKKYACLAGHYGTAWQNQQKEFDGKPAAFIFNTNCIQEPRDSYKDRTYTTSLVGWPGANHIDGYDFAPVIAKAKELGGFQAEEKGQLTTGFGHNAVLSVADKVVEGVKAGAIKHFFLVGGCDGARPGRNYYTDLVEEAPEDTVILTLACGKFRFNHLQDKLGDIGGVPRLLDVGQCNDAYSAVLIANALGEAFDCGINDLPLSFILSWYEQKAVVVLLSLLHLGVQGIRLGPSLPAFITPNILDFLIETFDIKPIGNSARGDLEEILGA